MSPDRFQDLAHAYGGQLRLWPAKERSAAEALLRSAPGLQAILDDAAGLDGLLGADAEVPTDPALARRIALGAPKAHPARPVRPTRAWRWAGAGLATAAAGATMGALIVSLAPPPGANGGLGWVYDQTTAFGALGPGQDS
jgi:hypothetical protein